MAARMYTCGVPREHCTGTPTATSAMMEGASKTLMLHPSREHAFKCKRRYLVKVVGAEPVGPREFRMPDGGPICVLAKKSHFGGEMMVGKYTTRYMPARKHRGGMIAGH